MGNVRGRIAARGLAGLALLAALAVVAGAAHAEEPASERGEPEKHDGFDESIVGASPAGDSGFLDTPLVPGRDITGAFRGDVGTLLLPGARAGSTHVSLTRPGGGLRVEGPLADNWAARVSVRASASRYRFDDEPKRYATLLDDLDLYAARVSLESSYLLDVEPRFSDEESWSLIGSLSGRSRWEDGDFGSGISGTAAFGVGYDIPDRLRLALGITLQSSLEEGGLEPGPFVSIVWDVTDRLTVRTHDLGGRIEYDLTNTLELRATGARSNDGFVLTGRAGVPDDLSFRDRYWRFSGGADWKLANWLRLDFDVGMTAERRIRVSGEDLGTLVSQRVDPSVFIDLRLEVRL